jgi:hypothetical protein
MEVEVAGVMFASKVANQEDTPRIQLRKGESIRQLWEILFRFGREL